MRLDLLTWQEVEHYLTYSKAAIIPIGSTEQHGPIGLLGTDALTAEIIARQLGEEEKIVVTPTISVGMAQHHLGFAGTLSLRPTTLLAVIEDYVASLTQHGFQHFFFINGHGGNIATITTAFDTIYAQVSFQTQPHWVNVRCKLCSWFLLPEIKALARELFGDQEGYHATPSEIAITQYAYPAAIKTAQLAPIGTTYQPFTHAKDFRNLYPDGRMAADSSLATPELGKRIIEMAVKATKRELNAFLQTPSH